MRELLQNGCVFYADEREYTILSLIGRGANTAAYYAKCKNKELESYCILKEYNPLNSADNKFEAGMIHFQKSAVMQNNIRQNMTLENQTPPVSHIFEANGTVYIDVVCCSGATLDKLDSLCLLQNIQICQSIAKTVGYYHKSGYICLDLKPENIFVLQNSPDDTITQIVEFIDFDSVRKITPNGISQPFFYTRAWAAPEQLNSFSSKGITKAADIYSVGEIIFYLLFGRHSQSSEHRGFSSYPFNDCKSEFAEYTVRPDVQRAFTQLFRGTLRSSSANRFESIEKAAEILGKIAELLEQKNYVVPKFPAANSFFVGRNAELTEISEYLEQNNVLFITGVGGIGKSSLVKKFIALNKSEYDVIAYLEYDGNFQRTFTDDTQLQISTINKLTGESLDNYYSRKLKHFKLICTGKKVLFVLDNYTGRMTKPLSEIISCGYDTIIVSRNQPPKNSFSFIQIDAISDTCELFRLITLNLERKLTDDEKACFEEIIRLTEGHTLVLELIARQIAAGKFDIGTALELIRRNGFSHFSQDKIGNIKDGVEVYDTLYAIVAALFSAGNMPSEYQTTLKTLALFDARGLDKEIIRNVLKLWNNQILAELTSEGWIYSDDRIKVHPVIAEAVKSWKWTDTVSSVRVMEIHKAITDIYKSMANYEHIRIVLNSAESYARLRSCHFILAMYFDMLGTYYDTLLDGNYIPYNDEEEQILIKLINAMENAVYNMEKSSQKNKEKYLVTYYLSLAAIYIRHSPEYSKKAEKLLKKSDKHIRRNENEICENKCSYYMVSAWYFTLAKPDLTCMKSCAEKAYIIAKEVYKTDVEIIDIIHIPAANCFFYHGDYESALKELKNAARLCEKYPDSLVYIDKRVELLNCQLDVCFETGNSDECRSLINEIDSINDKYREHGICREVPLEIREQIL